MDTKTKENRIEQLKARSKHCVCKYCGKKLSIKHIVFNEINEAKVELFCDKCQRIEYGVEEEIYHCASNMIDHLEFDYYDNMDENESKRQMNIAKICEILGWCCKNMGLINREGFTVPISMNEDAGMECLVMKSQDVKIDENGEE